MPPLLIGGGIGNIGIQLFQRFNDEARREMYGGERCASACVRIVHGHEAKFDDDGNRVSEGFFGANLKL
ncbi:MAG: hypothetical protein IPO22_23930 [Anaerolineales bacterium]|nr:hypothetical protein [Anaerolineales bacterium]